MGYLQPLSRSPPQHPPKESLCVIMLSMENLCSVSVWDALPVVEFGLLLGPEK